MERMWKDPEAWMTGAEGERTPDKAGPHSRGAARSPGSQIEIIPFFRHRSPPNSVRFLLGSLEASACVEVLSPAQFTCCPKEHGSVLAFLAEVKRFIEQSSPDTDSPIFGVDEEPAKLSRHL